MEVRTEHPEDVEAVRNVNIVAFERENEADLVERIGRVCWYRQISIGV
jgi:putative acetyltransferase